jgi:tetratricopeptide (TPR) repeat protein
VADVRAACEAVIAACKTTGKFGPAARAAEVYAAVAEGGKDRELWADVMTAWATTPGTTEAADKFKKAADEYAKLAEGRPDAAKAALYQKAAAAYQSAGDTPAATAVLAKLSAVPGASGEVQMAVHLQRAESLIADGKTDEGVKLLNEAANTAGPVGTRATLKLALVYAGEGKKQLAAKATEADGRKQVEYAADLLTQLANKTYTTADERLCHQQALYELGKLQLGGAVPAVQNVSDAEMRFRRLTSEYKTGPYAESGTMFLGIALSQLAQGAASGGVPPADAAKKFAEARTLFESLGKAADEFVRTQADIRLVHTLLHMKEYADATATGTTLADTYRGKVEELILLSIVYSAHSQSRRPDLAKLALERMQKAFTALPDTAYSSHMPEYTRAYWTKQLDRLSEK